ncbi:MAG TPA: P1 family peptidase [Ktedonobacterales bacterium]|nr:P1 family peptidase [Ktedonobacterales bacterium]
MPERNDDLCDVPGILVGHDTDLEAGTGCTVIRCAWPALGAVDVRGGAPGTRETDLLDPRCMMTEVHAVVLTGGSAFGLAAADGVMRALAEEGIGFNAGPARVPIVPAAVLFDLGVGRADVRPDAASGMRALQAAAGAIAQGTVGAGTGATVGKMAGPALAVKGGIGSASEQLPDGHVIGALVAVNALGDIYDAETGRLLAGARSPSGQRWLADDIAAARSGAQTQPISTESEQSPFPGAQTTLAVIATDAPFTKAELAKLAQMAHDGLALAIRPVHTPFDGDIVFALSTDKNAATAPPAGALPLALAGGMAAQTLARAVANAIRAATGLHGVPALRDIPFAHNR